MQLPFLVAARIAVSDSLFLCSVDLRIANAAKAKSSVLARRCARPAHGCVRCRHLGLKNNSFHIFIQDSDSSGNVRHLEVGSGEMCFEAQVSNGTIVGSQVVAWGRNFLAEHGLCLLGVKKCSRSSKLTPQ